MRQQEQLIEYLDTRLDRLQSLQRVLREQVDTLVAYRKSLIHECVTGQQRAAFAITDAEALYIKEVTEEKTQDQSIRVTVQAHREDREFLEGSFKGQVNGQIQAAYVERGRYDELADEKYTDAGAIFDIMAVTVIQHHHSSAP